MDIGSSGVRILVLGAKLKDSIKKINTLIDYSNKINKQL